MSSHFPLVSKPRNLSTQDLSNLLICCKVHPVSSIPAGIPVLSTNSLGARFAGKASLSENFGLVYQAEYANQTNIGDNPADITQIHHHLTEPVDALAAELSKCVRYYESVFRGRPVERAIFLGGQAYDKELCQALARRLNLPAQIGDPLLRIKRPTGSDPDEGMDHREPQPDWAVAVGLSVGAETAA